MWGCTSYHAFRLNLGIDCVTLSAHKEHLSLWNMNLWEKHDLMKPNTSLHTQVESLVIGYLQVYELGEALKQQFIEISSIDKGINTTDLLHNLGMHPYKLLFRIFTIYLRALLR